MRRSGRIKWGFVIVFLAAVLVLAGYAWIPFARLGTAVTDAMSEDSPNAVFSCTGGRWKFPLSLALDGFKVEFKNGRKGPLEAATLVLRPRVLEVLLGRLSLLSHADAYGGKLDCDIDFIRYFEAKGPLRARIKAADIDLGQCVYVTQVLGAPLKGKFKGTVEYTGDSADLLRGAGQGHFTISNADLQMPANAAWLGAIRFDRLDAEVAFEDGKLKVGKLILSGHNFQSVLKGYIFFGEILEESRVSLSGNIEMPALRNINLNFAVTGTVSKPVITLMG